MDLELGETICDKCNGTGINSSSLHVTRMPDSFYKPYNPPHIERTIIGSKCNKCFGKGKLDWIENIVGKKDSNLHIMSQIIKSSKKPINPRHGDMYYNTSDSMIYLYAIDEWVRISEEI